MHLSHPAPCRDLAVRLDLDPAAHTAPIERLNRFYDASFEQVKSAGADNPCVFATAPGRVELAGNHTDHQGGRVVSAAIGERMYARARANGAPLVRVAAEGFGRIELDLADPAFAEPVPQERGTSMALVRGMVSQLVERGVPVAGFDMAVVSNVPAGFGVSSSAAFEVLVGAALEALFAPELFEGARPCDPVDLALAGVAAERAYFGKPCGAQDQISCAVGGVVAMDFAQDPPVVGQVACDFAQSGHTAFLVDAACDHSVHNDLFAAIPAEMRAVAQLAGRTVLGEVDPAWLYANLPAVRAALGDRAALRALHYFDETDRASRQRAALERGDYAAFLQLVRLSGASSAQYLQNVSSQDGTAVRTQPAMVVLALCAHLLGERGAWRIHGGGFGGSVLAFAPCDEAERFAASMNAALGYDACRLVAPGAPGARAVVLP